MIGHIEENWIDVVFDVFISIFISIGVGLFMNRSAKKWL